MPATVKNKGLMKICETYVDILYYQREETYIAGTFIDGDSEIEKNDKDCRKKTQSKQRKDEEVYGTSSRDIRIFFEKRGTVSSTKTSTPKNVVELSDDE